MATKAAAKKSPAPPPKSASPADELPPPLKFKMPKTLAGCADLLYTTRKERLAADKEAQLLKSKEHAITTHLINNLPKSDATGISGRLACATIQTDTIPVATDWSKLYKYIVDNFKKNPGVFSLLHKRIGNEAVKEIWASKKKVPGIGSIDVKKVSLTSVK